MSRSTVFSRCARVRWRRRFEYCRACFKRSIKIVPRPLPTTAMHDSKYTPSLCFLPDFTLLGGVFTRSRCRLCLLFVVSPEEHRIGNPLRPAPPYASCPYFLCGGRCVFCDVVVFAVPPACACLSGQRNSSQPLGSDAEEDREYARGKLKPDPLFISAVETLLTLILGEVICLFRKCFFFFSEQVVYNPQYARSKRSVYTSDG